MTPPRQGILAALWLPTDDQGEIVRPALAANIAFLKNSGVHGFLVLGSTGQFPFFTIEQRQRCIEFVAEAAAPLPVIANVSDIRPTAVAEVGRFARRIGLPAIAVMPPGFYPAAQSDILEHLLHAADASGLPTLVYNYPELTGSRINLETIDAFADRAPIAGVKQSGNEFAYHTDLVRLGRARDFPVFTGADTRLPDALAIGAAGSIGGLANLVPELVLEIYRQLTATPIGSFSLPSNRLQAVAASIGSLAFPLSIAAGMAARRLPTGAAKSLVSTRTSRLQEAVVHDLALQFARWGLPSLGEPYPPSP